jgi:uncharacterized phage-associated protein
MAQAVDVATYILERLGPMPAMKLQKLVYYSHAWHLVWEDAPLLTNQSIEAWANGPVVRDLYREHRLQFIVDTTSFHGDSSRLTEREKSSIDAVLSFYGSMSAHELSQLTHYEDPWRDARERAHLKIGERGTVQITDADMAEYYGALAAG